MISHFQFQPLYENSQLPGWKFSFYFKKQHYTGIYHQSGNIEWTTSHPNEDDEKKLSAQIHELMLFHVYEK
ncbi:YheE family protein [Bacillus marasmi]|uniref:YheE family protein n=1 Tax=Bacillus marasmi TaxID=1926279 RepID=UPI0011C781DA|nr:YheE family protein [Bacillus marasmi]